jgi:hypothetical protein
MVRVADGGDPHRILDIVVIGGGAPKPAEFARDGANQNRSSRVA